MAESSSEVVANAQAFVADRARAAKRLGLSDNDSTWNVLIRLARDKSTPELLALEVGVALAHVVHRVKTPEGFVRGENENFLLRDFSPAAYEGYDKASARLADAEGKRFMLEDEFHAQILSDYPDEPTALAELSRLGSMDSAALDGAVGRTPCMSNCGSRELAIIRDDGEWIAAIPLISRHV